tara:strand:- start:2809 stop:3198 length:390 start_codon:yes stop_codon:yes gene_type:complete
LIKLSAIAFAGFVGYHASLKLWSEGNPVWLGVGLALLAAIVAFSPDADYESSGSEEHPEINLELSDPITPTADTNPGAAEQIAKGCCSGSGGRWKCFGQLHTCRCLGMYPREKERYSTCAGGTGLEYQY